MEDLDLCGTLVRSLDHKRECERKVEVKRLELQTALSQERKKALEVLDHALAIQDKAIAKVTDFGIVCMTVGLLFVRWYYVLLRY